MANLTIGVNALANLVGRVWMTVVAIIFVPIYIRWMGIETYGLVGFYATLLSSMSILDFGLSTTLNRELAKANAAQPNNQYKKNLVFTLEVIYWVVGLLISLSVIFASKWIAVSWINSSKLSIETVQHAVLYMGIIVAFQWPISLYSGGLMGIEKQVLNNGINIFFTSLRSIGVLLLMWLIAPTIEVFFIWQAIVSFCYVLCMRYALLRNLPLSEKDTTIKLHFSIDILKKVGRFSLGMTGISLVTFFLTQLDKIVVSKMASLTDFAHYTLAFSVAAMVQVFISPLTSAIFPRLTELANDESRKTELIAFYHQNCQIASSLVFCTGITLIIYAPELLFLWTHDKVLTTAVVPLVRCVVIGTICNSLMWMPYYLMLAKGWTRFSIYQNIVASIILVPLLYFWTSWYGVIGATFVWLTVNIGYVLISSPIVHHIMMKGEITNWYINDIGKPLLIILPIITLSHMLIPTLLDKPFNIFLFLLILLLANIIAIAITNFNFFLTQYKKYGTTFH